MAGHGGGSETGNVRVVDRGLDLTDEIGRLAPSGAQHEGDVVLLDARAFADDAGSVTRDLEGVDGRVGKGGEARLLVLRVHVVQGSAPHHGREPNAVAGVCENGS